MLVLGVESSCDETSVAIVKDGKEVLCNVIHSQIDVHQRFGGVVPEIASRHHVYQLSMVFERAFQEAKIQPEEIDLVAVTQGPGLVGSLLVGINAAKTFAMLYRKPIIGVHHLAGHIYANAIEHDMRFPAVALLVSGGNTELIYMKDHFEFEVIGQTLDDAVGEAYDKVARVIGLPYPGGPAVDRLSFSGNDTYALPRVYLEAGSYHFSFSGLKSAVINLVHQALNRGEEIRKEDLCASFQAAVSQVLVDKTFALAKEKNVQQIIVAGGVSANQGLKERFMKENPGFEICIPSIRYCTDNAAMIAVAGYYQYRKTKQASDFSMNADASLELSY
ncbi:MAG TPA: tRNA (adenosine(37)-N6)-threonylcarbamoyltransferase complex transferase subunit TsaD [Candidatus Pelethenecus faecipullorum]|uniref:tRNA N6-adenosine threonylcarbamoyltransferase n=1 Tax=Candidatus Pelethenecus faecipullorum TaxID=2840900 RepID=A0A9D1GPU8_9MOLU|nr:tRNA (adenosine(37)-N6)-threonylcarbamoyltransferase complex transferase subunit TsaD [Candidatus Pelethenecus faecipullorum]